MSELRWVAMLYATTMVFLTLIVLAETGALDRIQGALIMWAHRPMCP